MAKVRALIPGTQSIRKAPSEVDCFYQVISDVDGNVVLHLTTFGSDQRKSTKKSSQSLQIDKKIAKDLVALLDHVFQV